MKIDISEIVKNSGFGVFTSVRWDKNVLECHITPLDNPVSDGGYPIFGRALLYPQAMTV